MITVTINGASLEVPGGTTVAAAVMRAGVTGFRPLCGMGICFECRVAIDGVPEQRACLAPVRAGMRVETGAVDS